MLTRESKLFFVVLAPFLALTAAGLYLGCDSPFIPRSVVRSFRVLAVRAQPPEVRPNQPAHLSLLAYDPAGRPISYAWFACDPPTTADLRSPCEEERFVVDPSLLAGAPGVRPLGTSSTAVYTFSGDLASVANRPALVLLVARAGNDQMLVRKEVIVSDSIAPNQNPSLEYVLVEGFRTEPDKPVGTRMGRKLAWSGIVTSTSAELYQRAHPDGTTSRAIEDIRLEWFTTNGRFGVFLELPTRDDIIDRFVDSGIPAPPDASVREGGGESAKDEFGVKVTLNLFLEYNDPPLPPDGIVHVFVVVRDARGGLDWAERLLLVR